jgi:hypothetical protein
VAGPVGRTASPRSICAEDFLLDLVGGIQKGLKRRKMEIAHLKASLAAWDGLAAHLPGTGKARSGRTVAKVPKVSGSLGSGTGVDGLQAHPTLAAVRLVQSAGVPEVTRRMDGAFTEGELLINLRAEGDPVKLAATVTKALADAVAKQPGLAVEISQMEHFRPGQPKPTHRVGLVE